MTQTPVTLPFVRAQKESTEAACEVAWEEIQKIASKTPEGLVACAALEGYRRELAILQKMELDLITHGKPSEPEA